MCKQSINDGKFGLGINVDVANTCFWVAQNFEDLVRNYLGSVDRRWSGGKLLGSCRMTSLVY